MRNVEVKVGDIFKSKAQTLVNTVNCVGIMGKGIALGFKQRFPEMFEDYVRRCARREVKLGVPYLYQRPTPPWIINFPTKDHWRSVARLEDIETGLRYLAHHYREWGVTSLAVPPLGCGEGQLEWAIVGPTLYRHLSQLTIPVELYAPYGTPHGELVPSFLAQRLPGMSDDDGGFEEQPTSLRVSAGEVALVEILARMQSSRYRWPVGRTSFQKLAYFATQSGIPTGLDFSRASFGPHTEGLKRVITRLSNNGLIEEERLGNMFAVRVGRTFADGRHVFQQQLKEWEPIIERVVDLMVRITKTREAETAATVHFAAEELIRGIGSKPDERDVLNAVMSWKLRRKPPLEPSEVAQTIRMLGALQWLDIEPSADLEIDELAALGVD